MSSRLRACRRACGERTTGAVAQRDWMRVMPEAWRPCSAGARGQLDGAHIDRAICSRPATVPRTIPRSVTAVRRRNRGGSWGSGRSPPHALLGQDVLSPLAFSARGRPRRARRCRGVHPQAGEVGRSGAARRRKPASAGSAEAVSSVGLRGRNPVSRLGRGDCRAGLSGRSADRGHHRSARGTAYSRDPPAAALDAGGVFEDMPPIRGLIHIRRRGAFEDARRRRAQIGSA